MGFYFQDDYWEAVNELPIKQRNQVIVAIVNYYYTLEEPELKGAPKAVFCAVRERVKKARQEADRKRTNRGQIADINGTESGQNQDRNRTNSECSLNKEGEGEGNKEGIAKAIPKKDTQTIAEVIDYLNAKLGTRYKATSVQASKHINARINEGYTLDDFKAVIDKKCSQWKNDPNMAKFLRPETLFGTKFDGYLNEPVSEKEVKADEIFSGIGELW